MTACECPQPGWCQRHGVRKSPHLHRLCQHREDYFRAWEEGRGPGQLRSNGQSVSGGPLEVGNVLRQMLGCGSTLDPRPMNNWGPDECERRVDQIVPAVMRCRQIISEDHARRLLEIAIRKVRESMPVANTGGESP